jgi:uncharacterized membrane protein
MEKLVRTGRIFYGSAMAAVGFQQFFTEDFHAMILPPIHPWIPWLSFWAYVGGAALMVAGAAIVFEKKAGTISLLLGSILFAICLYYIPYEIIVDPNANYFGSWGDAQKRACIVRWCFCDGGFFF